MSGEIFMKRSAPEINNLLGCRLDVWLGLLWKNARAVSKKRVGMIVKITLLSALLFIPSLIEDIVVRVKSRRIKVEAPVFILGHWRSGTTYLFKLMSMDKRFGYMNSTETYMFNNCYLLGGIINRVIKLLIPAKRPMDNMVWTVDSPQEECFAISLMTDESMIPMIDFPRNRDAYIEKTFEQNLTGRWQKAHLYVTKKLTLMKKDSRLLLKSPDNTAKAALLAEMYPGAKFVNIYRDPYVVIDSTLNMYRRAFSMVSLGEMPDDESLEDFLVGYFEKIYRAYFDDLAKLPEDSIVEISYDELTGDPLAALEKIYGALRLDGFEEATPDFAEYIASQKSYVPNVHGENTRLRAKIASKLQFYYAHYGMTAPNFSQKEIYGPQYVRETEPVAKKSKIYA